MKRMDVREFRERGYLLELNRRFLHRLGLALEVVVEADGSMRLGGIWDCRDDPEGTRYVGLDDRDREAAERVAAELAAKDAVRMERFGWTVQPIPAAPRGFEPTITREPAGSAEQPAAPRPSSSSPCLPCEEKARAAAAAKGGSDA